MIPSIGLGCPFNCGYGVGRGREVAMTSWEDWGNLVLGAAMPNGPKNKSPPISMKFGDILESTLTKM